MQKTASSSPSATSSGSRRSLGRVLLVICIVYLALLLGQPAGLDLPAIGKSIAANPSAIPQQLITGISNGAIIAIIALGYTLVYGIIELVNFAHSSVFMLGAFFSLLSLGFFVNRSENGAVTAPFWAALVSFIPPMLLCAVLNATIERLAYRRLRDAPRIIALISAIGVDFVLQNVGLQLGALGKLPQVSSIFAPFAVLGTNNASPKSFPTILSNDNLLGTLPVRVTVADVMVVVTAVILMLALRWFIQSTKQGKAMRATAQNRSAAMIMGIDINKTISLTFLIGGALAGAAGMMFGLYNGTAVFTMGFTLGLRAFTAAVLGGIGNITGAALGGIIIGVLASFSDQYLSVRWTNAWVFLVLVLVMVFRPTGLLGQDGGEKA